jgi:CRISPR/Cas system-associated exonuclease Cas4 (RecB family)
MKMPISNRMKLFRTPEGKPIEYIRVSTLAGYWFCASKAYLQALGIESPSNEATEAGTKIHNDITAARKPTALEAEFESFLKGFMVCHESGKGSTGLSGTEDKVFTRAWHNSNGEVVGYITSHGFDDFRVYPDKSVVIVEYKTTAQKVIDYYKLSTALFQLRVYMWLLEPLLKAGGYTFKHGEIVYLNRKGQPLGIKTINDYTEKGTEDEIRKIFEQFGNPNSMIAPARYKCYSCHPNFKSRCLFQGVPQQ